jgi:hypothetical protein
MQRSLGRVGRLVTMRDLANDAPNLECDECLMGRRNLEQ